MGHQCLMETKIASLLVAVDRIYSKSTDFTCIPGARSARVDRQMQTSQRGIHVRQWHKVARDGSSLVQLDTKSILIVLRRGESQLKEVSERKILNIIFVMVGDIIVSNCESRTPFTCSYLLLLPFLSAAVAVVRNVSPLEALVSYFQR